MKRKYPIGPMKDFPVMTASGDKVLGEECEQVATVYGDPELATIMAASVEVLEALEEIMGEPPDEGLNRKVSIRHSVKAFSVIAKARDSTPATVVFDLAEGRKGLGIK